MPIFACLEEFFLQVVSINLLVNLVIETGKLHWNRVKDLPHKNNKPHIASMKYHAKILKEENGQTRKLR